MNLITDTSFRDTTLAALAQERASLRPDDTALLFDSGVRLSFAVAWQQANKLANAIQQLGVNPGATLTFQLPNIPEAVDAALFLVASVVTLAPARTIVPAAPLTSTTKEAAASALCWKGPLSLSR